MHCGKYIEEMTLFQQRFFYLLAAKERSKLKKIIIADMKIQKDFKEKNN